MHVAFRRIITENTIDHDLLLMLIEPTLLPTEQTLRLRWTWREVEIRDDANYASNQALKSEQIPPIPELAP